METVHLNIALDGCASPSLPPPIRISGTLTGALVTNTGTSCATSLGAVARASIGTLTAKWKTHGAKIGTSSSFAPEKIRPIKPHGKASVNQAVKIGGPGSPRPVVVGDFTGGNGGRGSSFTLIWKQSAATCAVGLGSLPIISGSLTFLELAGGTHGLFSTLRGDGPAAHLTSSGQPGRDCHANDGGTR